MRRSVPLTGLLALGLLCAQTDQAPAQKKPEPPRRPPGQTVQAPDTGRTRAGEPLPNLELPEYDITGTLVPGIGVSAKSPADQETVLDPLAGQRPRYGGPYVSDQSAWKEGARFPGGPAPAWGRVLAGYGWYVTPFVHAWYGQPGGAFSYNVRAGFESSQGAIENQEYTRAYGALIFGWELGEEMGTLERSDVRLGAGWLRDGYRLFGSLHPGRERSVTHFKLGVGLASSTTGEYSTRLDLLLRTTSVKDSLEASDVPVGLRGSVWKAFETFDVAGSAELWAHPYSSPAGGAGPYYTNFAAEGRTSLPGDLEIRGGVAFSLFRGTDTPVLGRLYPKLTVTWYAARWISVFAAFDPALRQMALGDVFTANPYASADFPLRHQERFVDLRLGSAMTVTRALTLRLVAGYARTNNALVFSDTARAGLWRPFYDGTSSEFELSADATWIPGRHDQVVAALAYRTTRNSMTDRETPYAPVFTAELQYEHRFDIPLSVGAGLVVTGRRFADLANERALEPFTLAELRAAYQFLRGWSVQARVENLFGVSYQWWEGYAGLPARGSLGVRYSW